MVKLVQFGVWVLLSLHLLECHLFIPTIPEHCLSQDFCEDVPNYPYKYVNEIIKQLAEQGYMWQSDVDSGNQSLPSVSSSGKDKFVDICPSTITVIAPLAVKNSEGQWRFVINGQNPPPQILETVHCNASVINNTCGSYSTINVEVQSGYYSQCQQEYLGIELTSLDEYGRPYIQMSQFPVCCSCAVFSTIENKI